jgi:hypothetical protein
VRIPERRYMEKIQQIKRVLQNMRIVINSDNPLVNGEQDLLDTLDALNEEALSFIEEMELEDQYSEN